MRRLAPLFGAIVIAAALTPATRMGTWRIMAQAPRDTTAPPINPAPPLNPAPAAPSPDTPRAETPRAEDRPTSNNAVPYGRGASDSRVAPRTGESPLADTPGKSSTQPNRPPLRFRRVFVPEEEITSVIPRDSRLVRSARIEELLRRLEFDGEQGQHVAILDAEYEAAFADGDLRNGRAVLRVRRVQQVPKSSSDGPNRQGETSDESTNEAAKETQAATDANGEMETASRQESEDEKAGETDSPDAAPAAVLLPLGSIQLPIQGSWWRDGPGEDLRPARAGLDAAGRMSLLVERTSQWEFDWSLRGATNELGDVRFDLRLPASSSSRLILTLPADKRVVVDAGLVTRLSADSEGVNGESTESSADDLPADETPDVDMPTDETATVVAPASPDTANTNSADSAPNKAKANNSDAKNTDAKNTVDNDTDADTADEDTADGDTDANDDLEPAGGRRTAHRWQIELGGRRNVTLWVVSADAVEARPAPVVLLPDSQLRYELTPRGLQLTADISLDVYAAPLHELTVSFAEPLGLVSARLDDLDLTWTARSAENGSRRAALQLPQPILGTGHRLRVACLAPPVWDQRWRLPGLRLEGARWLRGEASVETPDSVTLKLLDVSNGRESSVSPLPNNGQLRRIQMNDLDAGLTVVASPREPELELSAATHLHFQQGTLAAVSTLEAAMRWGEAYELTATVPKAWLIDKVESLDGEAGFRASVLSAGALAQRIRIEWQRPVTAMQPARIRIRAHREAPSSQSPMDSARIRLIESVGGTIRRHVWAITAEAGSHVRVSDSGPELQTLTPEVVTESERQALPIDQADLILLEDAALREASFDLVQQQPVFSGEMLVTAEATEAKLACRYIIQCQTRSSPLRRMLVHFSEPSVGPIEWSLTGETPATVSATRIDKQAAGESRGETWELTWSAVQSGRFEIIGNAVGPLNESQRLPLVSLPDAAAQVGRLLVVNQGAPSLQVVGPELAPIPVDVLEAGRFRHVIGKYRYDPVRNHEAQLTVGTAAEASVNAWVWRRQTLTFIAVDGDARQTSRLRIQNHGQPTLFLQLPSDFQLTELQVDDDPAVPPQFAAPRRLAVELPEGKRFVDVTLHGRLRTTKPADGRSVEIQAPHPEAPVLRSEWRVGLPNGLTLAAPSSQMNVAERWRHGTSLLLYGAPYRAGSRTEPALVDERRSVQRMAGWHIHTAGDPAAKLSSESSHGEPDALRGAASGSPSSIHVDIVAWTVRRAWGWSSMLFCTAAGWWIGRRWPAGWGAAALTAWCGLTMGPPEMSALFVGGFWGAALAGLLCVLSAKGNHAAFVFDRDASTVAAAAAVARGSSMSVQKLACWGIIGFGLAAATVALDSLRAQDVPATPQGGASVPTRADDTSAESHSSAVSAPSPAPVYSIYIPVDKENQPADDFMYVPPALYEALTASADDDANRPHACLWHTARYVGEFAPAQDGRAAGLTSLTASYDIVTLEPSVKVTIPALRRQTQVVSLQLDGAPLPIEWTSSTESIVVEIAQPGEHHIVVAFQPQTTVDSQGRTRAELNVPPIPQAQLLLAHVDVADDLKFPTALGPVSLRNVAGETNVTLGPAERLAIEWKSDSGADSDTPAAVDPSNASDSPAAPRGESPSLPAVDVAADMYAWLHAHPGGTLVECRWKLQTGGAPIRMIELQTDPRLQLLPAIWEPQIASVRFAGEDPRVIRVLLDRPYEREANVTLRFLWNPTETRGEILSKGNQDADAGGLVGKIRDTNDAGGAANEAERPDSATSDPNGAPDLPAKGAPPRTEDVERSSTDAGGVKQRVVPLPWPKLAMTGVRVNRHWIAVSSPEGTLIADEPIEGASVLDSDSFAAAWGDAAERPARAYALSGAAAAPPMQLFESSSPLSADEQLDIAASRREIELSYMARFAPFSANRLQYRFRVPAGLRNATAVVQSDVVEQVRPAVDGEGSLTVFLRERPRGELTIQIHGTLPTTLDRWQPTPLIRIDRADPPPIRVRVFRRSDIAIRWQDEANAPPPSSLEADHEKPGGESLQTDAAGTGGGPAGARVAKAGGSDVGANGPRQWHPRWGRLVLDRIDVVAAPTMRLSANQPAVSARTLTMLRQADGQFPKIIWEAAIDVTAGALDELRLEAPREWTNIVATPPAEITDEPAAPSSPRRRFTIRPAEPFRGSVRVRLSGDSSAPSLDGAFAPEIRWLGAAAVKSYLSLPSELDRRPITWETTGLRETRIPAEFTAETVDVASTNSATFESVASEYSAKLVRIERSTTTPQIRLADYVVRCDDAGRVYGGASFDLEPAGVRECRIEIPPGFRLLAVSTGDVPAPLPTDMVREWIIPVGPRRLPQRVEVLFAGRAEWMLGSRPGVELVLPSLADIPVERTLWTLYVDRSDAPESIRAAGTIAPIRQETFRLETIGTLMQNAADTAAEGGAVELDGWYQRWMRRYAKSRNRILSELDEASDSQRAPDGAGADRNGVALTEDDSSRGLAAAQSALDAMDDRQRSLAARLRTTELRSAALRDAEMANDSFDLVASRDERRPAAVHAMFVGARDRLTVEYDSRQTTDTWGRAVWTLLVCGAALLGYFFRNRLPVGEWAARWPFAAGALVGFAWWLWMPLGWIGWGIVAVSVLGALRLPAASIRWPRTADAGSTVIRNH